MDGLYTISIKFEHFLNHILELLTLGAIETILSEQDRYSPYIQGVHRKLEKADE